MRKWVVGILALAIVAVGLPAVAADGDFEFETEGQVRARFDGFENYGDQNDDVDDSVNAWPFRANIGLTGSFNEMFWGYVELQATGFFGDFNSGLQSYPGPSSGDVRLYQGYVALDTGTWDFRMGRTEHSLGNELLIGNNSFYNGQNFDGLHATGDFDSWDLNLYLYKVVESQTIPIGGSADDDINFYGVDASFKLGESNLTPYWLLLDGEGNGTARTNISTLGILWDKPTVDNTGWDLSVEFAQQFGEVGDSSVAKVDTEGSVFEGWFGWTFGGAGRVHIGYLWASGDDGSDPGSTDAFVPLFEDGHAYNRLGNLDLFASGLAGPGCALSPGVTGTTGCMSNVTDISVGYTWGPSADSKHAFYVAVHQLNFAETAPGVDDDIGLELDLTYSYEIVKNSRLEIGTGYLEVGDNFGPNADNLLRVFAQIEASWGKAKPWTSIGQQPGWNN